MINRWPDLDHIEEKRFSKATEFINYRQFRQRILAACRKKGGAGWEPFDDTPTFRMLRQRINAFRQHVRYAAADWIRNGTYPSAHIHRALRLDRDFLPELTRKDRWRRALMRWCSPHTTLRLAYPWLCMAGTYQGRAFIFDTRVPHPILGSRDHYSRAIDFGVMRWRRFKSSEELGQFSSLGMDWIRSARDLGMRDAASMIAWIPRPASREAGQLIWFLVRKGIILNLQEKTWITTWSQRPAYRTDSQLDEERLARVIDILLEHDVAREDIVKTLCTIPHHLLEPRDLTQTLTLLRSRGVTQYAILLEGLASCLFYVKPERWCFVLDTLGIRAPDLIVQFRTLLGTSRSCSATLSLALMEHGANATHLIKCQDLLCDAAAAGIKHDPAASLATLMAPPCGLSLDQIPEAANYLCRSGDLESFLGMLASHGFHDAATVLRFQAFFAYVDTRTLSRMIALAKPLAAGEIQELVDWIEDCGKTGHIDGYEYLTTALKLRTVPQLRQVARVGFLGVGMLRYLVEDQKLASKKTLMAWFYQRAFGIKAIRYWGAALDPVESLLFKDAFDRCAFNYWESNLACVSEVASKRVAARLGTFPYRTSEEEQRRYRDVYDPAYTAERLALMPLLTRMLGATSGIILAGLATSAWDSADCLDCQLESVTHLLNDLLAGQGPQGHAITAMEADAIALIYRSTPHTVQQVWGTVINRQTDVQDWALASTYPMKWLHASWTLKNPLDRMGFQAIGLAVTWAAAFRTHWHDDPPGALTTLRQANTGLKEGLAELLPELAVLLSIVHDDPIADVWLQGVPAMLNVDDERGFQHVLSLNAFFGIGLTDALQARLELFCHAQSNRSASLLARDLGHEQDGSHAPQAQLFTVLTQVAHRVRERYSDWASVELAKFGSADLDEGSAIMNAVVTKHPAAFFAKEAVKLCTAGNVAMWQEPRHAHLLVFDLEHRSLQGMALVYREILPALHPSRPTLVIRAINPTDDALATYHVASIVDAFLSTAVEIARASDCVAVAFPPNTGMHLLSNLDPIAKDIDKRYIQAGRTLERQKLRAVRDAWLRPAVPFSVSFDAYERNTQTIETLYLVWCDGV